MDLSTWELAESEGIVNLSIGQPHFSLIPWNRVCSAAGSMGKSQDPRHILQYSANLGTITFLTRLGEFLSHHYGTTVNPDCLFTSNGCSQAIELIVAMFSKPGDDIFVEEPCYHYVHQIFRDAGLNLHMIPHNLTGSLDLAKLEV